MKGKKMNNYEKLRRLAERFRAMYPSGTRIELTSMGSDPNPIPDGTRGTVDIVDDMGTIYCTFDNGRRLGIIPGEDDFRKLTQAELLDEHSQKLMKEYIDKINSEVLPEVEWENLNEEPEMIGLLRGLHDKFVEVYGSDTIDRELGFITVPAILVIADGRIIPALLDLDTTSSCEHRHTTFFTTNGVLSDNSDDPEEKERIRYFGPYRYWYTPTLEGDIHVDWDSCPDEIRGMLNEATEPRNEVKLE